jgi:type IV pilus assembly protein PilY1
LDNQTVDDQGIVLFPQLGESWSEPQLHLTQIGPTRKIVAFIGAGYDLDEDSRFGRSGRFPVPPEPAVGAGDVTSNTGMASPTEPPGPPGGMPRRASARGLGVYAFEVATINSNGIPIIPVSAAKVWGYTEVNDDGPKSGIPSDVTVLDSDHDGLADRLYVADLAGRLWRFTLGDGAERGWTGNVIFSPDVSSGRKVFYRPSVVQGPGYWMLGFGTGDRAHPLNTAVVDRFYMIKDLGQTTASGIDDSLLVDVTTNDLQLDDTDVTAREGILKELNASSKYGWYLDLDGLNQDGHHGGEKVLAAPLIYDGIAYFTTYMPDAPSIVSADPCAVGNPGTARLYAVDYRTGEAVLNFYIGNDDEPGTVVNKRAISPAGKVLRREDRGRSLGTGIPSGVVVMVPPSGDAEIIIGTDGGFSSVTPNAGGSVYQIYWKDW